MNLYLDFGLIQIPSYGFFIILGIGIANVIAFFYAKSCNRDFNDFILIECYCFLGGIIGSKILYLIVSFNYIDWDRFFEYEYFEMLMQNGFVFYGGLLGGIACAFLCGKIHKIDIIDYMSDFIFIVPFCHAFGRIGCFMAGCCYGIPYDGPFAVVFPENSFAISGVSLFPVQLVEAILLFVISAIVFLFRKFKNFKHTIPLYLIMYCIIRFFIEFLRYDSARGELGFLSISQFISICIIVILIIYLTICNKKRQST